MRLNTLKGTISWIRVELCIIAVVLAIDADLVERLSPVAMVHSLLSLDYLEHSGVCKGGEFCETSPVRTNRFIPLRKGGEYIRMKRLTASSLPRQCFEGVPSVEAS